MTKEELGKEIKGTLSILLALLMEERLHPIVKDWMNIILSVINEDTFVFHQVSSPPPTYFMEVQITVQTPKRNIWSMIRWLGLGYPPTLNLFYYP